ncbi:EAL domain-containing protein (putative c-di-GMP-specific phosphodiesterase class I) [Promicromonospora sp. AC04]|uniref:EAL domain-containing protein n=1 Tax=Promicromonospora sp. AC04 TaxID=2135723 RepID=UPI000D4722AA|nr:EAL domain-containing protein [Promicromonospora sp. AC04]PUB25392.1 EAL domain-containing protein (putative c-di-GMP-specific phosphodiesterase class I) [Promicromonospora sp. AC04]
MDISDLEAAIAHAVDHNELVLHYQPVIRVRTGTLEGFEALVRWERPGTGLVPPGEFVPAAETSDLICDLDAWVLNRATEQIAAWGHAVGDHDLTFAVNLSGRHINSSRVLDDVATALRRSGVDPGRLVLEITESVPVGDGPAVAHLRELRRLGIALALDDFGTKYSTVEQLTRLPIDIVKIDQSYLDVSTVTTRELFRSMVETIHACGFSVVAEGVEHLEQLELLRVLGVEFAQGFALGRPMTSAELEGQWPAPRLPPP